MISSTFDVPKGNLLGRDIKLYKVVSEEVQAKDPSLLALSKRIVRSNEDIIDSTVTLFLLLLTLEPVPILPFNGNDNSLFVSSISVVFFKSTSC